MGNVFRNNMMRIEKGVLRNEKRNAMLRLISPAGAIILIAPKCFVQSKDHSLECPAIISLIINVLQSSYYFLVSSIIQVRHKTVMIRRESNYLCLVDEKS